MVCQSPLPSNELSLNFVVEINDFGYPQNSEIDTLKSYITTESVVSAIAAVRTLFSIFLHDLIANCRRSHRRLLLKLLGQPVGDVEM